VSSHPVFVTRKFPPSIGGMQTLAAGVWRSMIALEPDATKISHGGSNRDLVWWLPISLVRLAVLIARRKVSFVLIGDALTYTATSGLLRVFGVPHATMIMGLDVTFENPIYQTLVRRSLRRAPQVIAISSATAERARALGVSTDRISVLRLGVNAPDVDAGGRAASSNAVRRHHQFAESDVLILTLGRLVKRKGVRWFVTEVLPALPSQVRYLVVGDGEERGEILAAAERAGVGDRVHLLGCVDDAEREDLLRGADLFIQPNIPVAGDMEGFGLVTIEAAMRGTPVVAAELEGIRDAVVDGRTGILLAPQHQPTWTSRLSQLVVERESLGQLGAVFQIGARELYGEAAMAHALGEQLGFNVCSPLATDAGGQQAEPARPPMSPDPETVEGTEPVELSVVWHSVLWNYLWALSGPGRRPRRDITQN
jgi:phosphatidylinositol alpha-1,6-mannosyltransferase